MFVSFFFKSVSRIPLLKRNARQNLALAVPTNALITVANEPGEMPLFATGNQAKPCQHNQMLYDIFI